MCPFRLKALQAARGKSKGWPPEAAQVLVMRYMHWSWQQLQACPALIYDRILTIMEVEAIAAEERTR